MMGRMSDGSTPNKFHQLCPSTFNPGDDKRVRRATPRDARTTLARAYPISDDRTGVENGVRAERSLFGPSHLHLEHSSSSDSLATHCHTPRAWPVNP